MHCYDFKPNLTKTKELDEKINLGNVSLFSNLNHNITKESSFSSHRITESRHQHVSEVHKYKENSPALAMMTIMNCEAPCVYIPSPLALLLTSFHGFSFPPMT